VQLLVLIITTSEDKTARLWRVSDGRQVTIFKGHEDVVTHTAFSHNSQHVITTSEDKTARLWHVDNGKQLRVLKGHKQKVIYAVFSHDDQRIVTTSYDKTARLWNAITGEQIAELNKHKIPAVTYAVFSPNDQYIVTISKYEKMAYLWNAENGQLLARLKHKGRLDHASFSSDSQTFITSGETASLWRIVNRDGKKDVQQVATLEKDLGYIPPLLYFWLPHTFTR